MTLNYDEAVRELSEVFRQYTPEERTAHLALVTDIVRSLNGEQREWILWEPTSSLPPTKTFRSLDRAFQVAEVMAKQFKKTFLVMEKVGSVGPVQPKMHVERYI